MWVKGVVLALFSAQIRGLFSRFSTPLKQAKNGMDWGKEKRRKKSDER